MGCSRCLSMEGAPSGNAVSGRCLCNMVRPVPSSSELHSMLTALAATGPSIESLHPPLKILALSEQLGQL